MKRKAIKAVLHNTLSSLLSRNTDYNGYWIWGFFVENNTIKEFTFPDLGSSADSPESFFGTVANRILNDQLIKAGFEVERVTDRKIVFAVGTEKRITYVNTSLAFGYLCEVRLQVLLDGDTAFQIDSKMVVARHNPDQEFKSTRDQQGNSERPNDEFQSNDKRKAILYDLVQYSRPIGSILEDLTVFPWDSQTELVALTTADLKSIMDRFLANEIDGAELEEWANAIECRDDIAYSGECRDDIAYSGNETVAAAIYDLANKDLSGETLSEIALRHKSLIDK